jgi:hypothetical protein
VDTNTKNTTVYPDPVVDDQNVLAAALEKQKGWSEFQKNYKDLSEKVQKRTLLSDAHKLLWDKIKNNSSVNVGEYKKAAQVLYADDGKNMNDAQTREAFITAWKDVVNAAEINQDEQIAPYYNNLQIADGFYRAAIGSGSGPERHILGSSPSMTGGHYTCFLISFISISSSFLVKRPRTKLLNSVLYEAGLDRQLCYENLDSNSWALNGHSAWHKINKK